MITLLYLFGLAPSILLAITLFDQEFRAGFIGKKRLAAFIVTAFGSWLSLLVFTLAFLFIIVSYYYKKELK